MNSFVISRSSTDRRSVCTLTDKNNARDERLPFRQKTLQEEHVSNGLRESVGAREKLS